MIFLNDKEVREHLFPFTLIRPAADIRIGMLTIREKWERLLGQEVAIIEDTAQVAAAEAAVFAANIIPSEQFIASLQKEGNALKKDPDWEAVKILQYPWHIFEWNDWALRQDFKLVTRGKVSQPIPESVQVINAHDIFIEEGARLSHCMLNATHGPIYVGKNAEIMEGSFIRGPFALCEGAVVKMGAKIYGATTIGPYCTVGGEIKNCVFFGYSNKAHDGYLGDAVIGAWCNLGAGSSNSNLKNNATDVRVWHHPSQDYIRAGMKCGLLMGDYSRAAINTAFNTGTVTGVCTNIFGEGLTPKYIPSFTWGSKALTRYEFEKALSDISNWKKLKNQLLTDAEAKQLKHIFEQS